MEKWPIERRTSALTAHSLTLQLHGSIRCEENEPQVARAKLVLMLTKWRLLMFCPMNWQANEAFVTNCVLVE